MDFATIKYAAVTRLGDEYPGSYMLSLTVKFDGSVDDTAEMPPTGLIVSSDLEGDILTVISTHRVADDLYAAAVTHLKRYDIVHSDYEPPVLSAKPDDLPVERTTDGLRRTERVVAGASN